MVAALDPTPGVVVVRAWGIHPAATLAVGSHAVATATPVAEIAVAKTAPEFLAVAMHLPEKTKNRNWTGKKKNATVTKANKKAATTNDRRSEQEQ